MTILILFVGVLLRTLMFVSDKSMWGDEWFCIELVRLPLLEVIRGAIHDVHPPLYFVLLKGMVGLFGEVDWTLRFISFVSSLGLLGSIYLLAKETQGRTVALFSLFLVAISPFWLQAANEVRSYSLFSFVVCLSAYSLVKALGEPDRRCWHWAYAVTAILSVWVEHYAWFWLAASTAYLSYQFFKQKAGRVILWFHGTALLVASALLPLVIYQAIYREGMFNLDRIKEYLSLSVLVKKLVGIFWHFTSGYQYSMITTDSVERYIRTSPFFWISATLTLMACYMMLRGFLALFKGNRGGFVWFATVLVLPIVFLIIFYPIRLDARYIIFAGPFYFILVAAGLNASGRYVRGIFLTLFICVNLSGAWQAIAASTDMKHKEDYKSLTAYVLERSGPRDAVCGTAVQADYYQRVLGQKFKGAFFKNQWEFYSSGRSDFNRVWMMDSMNMHPRVSDPQMGEMISRMAAMGYRPIVERKIFGGPDAVTYVTVFESLEQSGPAHVQA